MLPLLLFQARSPKKQTNFTLSSKMYVLCTCRCMHACACTHTSLSEECHLLSQLKGSLDLATLRAASYSLGIWGCWRELRKESVERKKWKEDKEELHVLCWKYLGDIRYIFMKKRGFLLKKKICSVRSSFIFTVYVCKSIVKSITVIKKKIITGLSRLHQESNDAFE